MLPQLPSAVSPPRSRSISPPLVSIPATPSLTKAMGKVTSAQEVAYQSFVTPHDVDPSGDTGKQYNGFDWDSFWKDINVKVRNDRHDE
jgi:hypothetical protein